MDLSSTSGAKSRKRKHSDDDDGEGDLKLPGFLPLPKDCDVLSDYGENSSSSEGECEEIQDYQDSVSLTQYAQLEPSSSNHKESDEDSDDNDDDEKKVGSSNQKDDSDDELKDSWAETVNWEEVKARQQQESGEKSTKPMDVEDSRPKPLVDRLSCYRQMLRIMRPDETVQRAIRRLGNDVPKRSRNTKAKSEVSKTQDSADKAKVDEAKRKLNELIELAHQRLEDGEFGIYQNSYDTLEEAINE